MTPRSGSQIYSSIGLGFIPRFLESEFHNHVCTTVRAEMAGIIFPDCFFLTLVYRHAENHPKLHVFGSLASCCSVSAKRRNAGVFFFECPICHERFLTRVSTMLSRKPWACPCLHLFHPSQHSCPQTLPRCFGNCLHF